jgi:hypothetical protein
MCVPLGRIGLLFGGSYESQLPQVEDIMDLRSSALIVAGFPASSGNDESKLDALSAIYS